MEVVEKLAAQLAPQGVPIIEVYNKADLVEPQLIPVGENKVAISAQPEPPSQAAGAGGAKS